ncbi:MAG: ParB/RepB/Spo0J family partition protein [Lachnospiraceae bacterium]|nr:ParB/RepB/Spo0J family partition protein [Lachnospiraceae bacterium]
MATKSKGLGKGLGALIPLDELDVKSEIDVNKKTSSPDMMIKISRIEPRRDQPRKTFNEDKLQELADSIKRYGIIEPIIVQEQGSHYEIVAGERRWRAARKAGLKEVPVRVKEFTEQEKAEISLIENLQREDLNPIEEALAYKTLQDKYNLKHDEVAERVSKSRTTITNSIRLLNLCEEVQQMLINEMISQGHARALLSIEDKEQQYNVAQRVFDENLSVRDIEKIVKDMSKVNKQKTEKKLDNEFIYKDFEEKMKNALGTKVIIKPKDNKKGKIEIEYYSANEFERIAEQIISSAIESQV